MLIQTGQIGNDQVTPKKMAEAFREGGYVRCLYDAQPFLAAVDGYGSPTGTDAQVNLAMFPAVPRALQCDYQAIGTETLLGPLLDFTTGLVDISEDQTAAEGVIYNFGLNHTRNPFLVTVGAGVERSFRHTWKIEDASGTATLAFGLFKLEANQPNIDDYDEAAFFDIVAGDVFVKTILNGAATQSVDTGINVADGGEIELEVRIRGRRVTFLVSGAVVGFTTFDFDSGEKLIPKGQLVHGTDVSKVYPVSSEFGPLACFASNP